MKILSELAVQNALHKQYEDQGWSVQREVETPVGRIDLLLLKPKENQPGVMDRVLIEVKERGGLKSAIGQVLMYAQYQRATRHCIIYFGYDGKDKPIPSRYKTLCEKQHIELYSIHQYLDLSLLLEAQRAITCQNPQEELSETLIPSNNLELIKLTQQQRLDDWTFLTEEIPMTVNHLNLQDWECLVDMPQKEQQQPCQW